jgi:hypothetical protein
VCTFTPREKRALRSYQKHEGKDELDVQESLAIALNLFSIESHAEELDAWLDGILDSDSELLEYVSLMRRRQKEDHYSQLLQAVIAWYLTSKDKVWSSSHCLQFLQNSVVVCEQSLIDANCDIQLSKLAHQILRPALKLLITTTLLSLVPKVTDLPESLSDYLSSHSSAQLSTDAPRLLTRQIKASVYHLQQHFLRALFCHFTYATKLKADVKIAVAFLVAYVLDLVRKDGRQFAKFLRTFNTTMSVTDQDVTEYETNMQSALFERVRASISDAVGRPGELVEGLRSLGGFSFESTPFLFPLTCDVGSMGKGKEKRSEEYQFVSAILDTVL